LANIDAETRMRGERQQAGRDATEKLKVGSIGYASFGAIASGKYGFCYFNGVKRQVKAATAISDKSEVLLITDIPEDYVIPTTTDYPAKKPYYDKRRNPKQIMMSYSGSVAPPHPQTLRWQYTVPAGRQAIVELLVAVTQRDAAASVAATASDYIILEAHGAGNMVLIYAWIASLSLGAQTALTVGTALTLYESDRLNAYTYDGSADGTVSYVISAKIIEFDA
jgi:hypothetical protein